MPWTYCWSEGLIEKPEDWKEHIGESSLLSPTYCADKADISGFYFYEADSDFEPDADLSAFLEAGEPPIYVGFGSVVVEDAAAMTSEPLLEDASSTFLREGEIADPDRDYL